VAILDSRDGQIHSRAVVLVEEVGMADRGSTDGDKVTKPCVCQLGVHVGLYKATGKADDRGRQEFRCRLCGRTEWRPA
jgi:hypothetical protein